MQLFARAYCLFNISYTTDSSGLLQIASHNTQKFITSGNNYDNKFTIEIVCFPSTNKHKILYCIKSDFWDTVDSYYIEDSL
jgi:2-oxo-4-hydroxy-4-carboxy--5-ureidoimidazoline (OHCU) decarboxylase